MPGGATEDTLKGSPFLIWTVPREKSVESLLVGPGSSEGDKMAWKHCQDWAVLSLTTARVAEGFRPR